MQGTIKKTLNNWAPSVLVGVFTILYQEFRDETIALFKGGIMEYPVEIFDKNSTVIVFVIIVLLIAGQFRAKLKKPWDKLLIKNGSYFYSDEMAKDQPQYIFMNGLKHHITQEFSGDVGRKLIKIPQEIISKIPTGMEIKNELDLRIIKGDPPKG